MKSKAIFFLLFVICSCNKTFSQSGILDTSFGTRGKDTIAMLVSNDIEDVQKEQIQRILIQKNQKIIVAGFARYETSTGEIGVSTIALARYNSDGSLDTTFGSKGKISKDSLIYSNDAALQSNDKIIVVGDRFDTSNNGYPLLIRFLSNGLTDTSFGMKGYADTTGMAHNRFFQTEVLSDNSIVVIGQFILNDSLNKPYCFVEKYLSNGVIDSSFAENGQFVLKENFKNPYEERTIMVQPDNKILIKTFTYTDTAYFGITRLTPSGKYDLSFGDSGKITTGIYNQLNNDDSINNITHLVSLLNDGKIIATGSHGIYYWSPKELTVYKTNGEKDSSFGINGKVLITDSLDEYSILIQKDNKIVFGGNYYDESQTRYPLSNFALSRFNANGTIDTTFGNKGLTITSFGVYSRSICSALQPDNKILLGGFCFRDTIINTATRQNFALARYNNDEGILPVSLFSFTATKQQQSVLLNWQTANEINNSYFSIERGSNSKIFTEINKVYRKGNASQKLSYNTTDSKPFQGWNYYRLKQVDKDGKYNYSSIASIYFDNDAMITIRPNPADNFIYVDGLKENTSADIVITDVNGKALSVIKTNQSSNKINIQNLATGIYYININQNGKSIKQKFVKQ